MTHRVFSRNAASSRAIPPNKFIDLVLTNPAMPVYWGMNQTGMKASEEHPDIEKCKKTWLRLSRWAIRATRVLNKLGLHKQLTNRLLEPFQMIKVVVTATEWENFFWLRDHKDAQPEIAYLAKLMREALDDSTPTLLEEGMWHLPYVDCFVIDGKQTYYINDEEVNLETAKLFSAARCAGVSYRSELSSIRKAREIYAMLIESEPCHASPVEHQATPIIAGTNHYGLLSVLDDLMKIEGVTHMDSELELWSNNFRGWIQYRALIPNNVKK